ncbi:MAG: hypothetical protein N3G76_01980 [Candidatus Micrarchaeota archaeon]|nr:hypothetical protein [Candidatus Micrarchaeota archaeon]
MPSQYLPSQKIVLVAGLEDTLIDRQKRTAYCVLRACKELATKGKIPQLSILRRPVSIESFWRAGLYDSEHIRAFIGLSSIASDIREYVPLFIAIGFGERIAQQYLADVSNTAYPDFFKLKISEMRQKYPAAYILGGNSYMYEEMVFDAHEWFLFGKKWPNTLDQLRLLRTVFAADATANRYRNAYELYFLTSEMQNSSYKNGYALLKMLVARGIIHESDISDGEQLGKVFIKEHLLATSGFSCGTIDSTDVLNKLIYITRQEKVGPSQVWLLSEGFIDAKGKLRSAGFATQLFLKCSVNSCLEKDAINSGMKVVLRDDLANAISNEARRQNF